MPKLSVLFVFAALLPVRSFAADQNQLDGNPTLFSVMAALNAAEMDTSSAAANPLRDLVRAHLATKDTPAISQLKNFVISHKKASAAANLQQYLSFALSVSDPPEFAIRFRPGEVPPDVLALEGFQPLMVRFHKEADIDSLWQKAQPYINQAIARYQTPVIRAVTEVNGYLRNPTSGYMGRRFQIFLDLLGPPNHIQSFSYGDDYTVVLTPAPEPDVTEVRHAYLHYLLDPLSIKFSEQINKKRGLGDFAKASPVLEESYKADFLLLTTESLIRAVEARLAKPADRAALVSEALEEGFVLTPYFAETLPAYEKQEVAMRLFLPDMVNAIDLKKEDRRLENVKFATTRKPGKLITSAQSQAPDLTPAQKTLDDAERLLYNDHNVPKAREAYLRVLEQTADSSLHARAYYGLARVAAMDKNPELAEKLFHKTLELAPDPQTKAWAQVYLGRLADLAGEREQAAQFYQAVLSIDGASPAARKAAEDGLKSKFQKN